MRKQLTRELQCGCLILNKHPRATGSLTIRKSLQNPLQGSLFLLHPTENFFFGRLSFNILNSSRIELSQSLLIPYTFPYISHQRKQDLQVTALISTLWSRQASAQTVFGLHEMPSVTPRELFLSLQHRQVSLAAMVWFCLDIAGMWTNHQAPQT